MKAYRITWHAFVEDESVVEGRSLIYAETEQQALQDLYSLKTSEYRLKPQWIQIQSIYELPGLCVESDDSSA